MIKLLINGQDLNYYVATNSRGDVEYLYRGNGTVKAHYTYDAWGNVLSVTDENGIEITDANNIGLLNPIRYRGYYYDEETGYYYLQSRYYNPEMGRFLNVDNQLNIADMGTGTNLFAYCGNDPVNRVDPTGEDWWHWVLGATIVVGCAVATVATCGGFAAAAGAVAAVGSGVVAATTASTIAAGALIGSATVYGIAVVTAATNSNSVKEFNDKGDWGTVAATAGGAILGGVSAGASAHMSTNRSSNNKTPVIGKMNDLNQLKLKKMSLKSPIFCQIWEVQKLIGSKTLEFLDHIWMEEQSEMYLHIQ